MTTAIAAPQRRGPGRPLQGHCKYGHPLAAGNLYVYVVRGRMHRQCRLCVLAAKKRWYDLRKFTMEERH